MFVPTAPLTDFDRTARCSFHKRRFHNDSRKSLNVWVADKNEARQSHFHGSGVIVKLILSSPACGSR